MCVFVRVSKYIPFVFVCVNIYMCVYMVCVCVCVCVSKYMLCWCVYIYGVCVCVCVRAILNNDSPQEKWKVGNSPGDLRPKIVNYYYYDCFNWGVCWINKSLLLLNHSIHYFVLYSSIYIILYIMCIVLCVLLFMLLVNLQMFLVIIIIYSSIYYYIYILCIKCCVYYNTCYWWTYRYVLLVIIT